jgi:hypothetical protein
MVRVRPFSDEQSRLWMAAQAKRNPLKRPKDRLQGLALLDAVAEVMPHYPLDPKFESELPEGLVPYFAEWRAQFTPTAAASW